MRLFHSHPLFPVASRAGPDRPPPAPSSSAPCGLSHHAAPATPALGNSVHPPGPRLPRGPCSCCALCLRCCVVPGPPLTPGRGGGKASPEARWESTSRRRAKSALTRADGGFPGGPVIKNPPANAGDVHSIPGQGAKIPQVAGQLSPHATTTEHACRNYRAHTLWSPRHNSREARVPQQRSHMPQCVLPGHKWNPQKGPDGGPLKRVPSEEAPGRARQPAPRPEMGAEGSEGPPMCW